MTQKNSKYYIGQTARKLKIRLNEHRSSIKRADMTSPVARHFCEHGHRVKDLKCIGIEKVVLNRRGGDQEKKTVTTRMCLDPQTKNSFSIWHERGFQYVPFFVTVDTNLPPCFSPPISLKEIEKIKNEISFGKF